MSPRDRILARRARFVAAALGSLGAVGAVACAEPCLSVNVDDTGTVDSGRADTSEGTIDTGRPQPCLSDVGPPRDTSTDTSVTDADTGADTGPMPCLIPPEDTG